MKSVRFTPGALAELTDSAVWYESRQPGLSDRFLEEFEQQLDLIRERPASFALLPEIKKMEVRRALLPHFPYSLIFLDLEDEIRVLAVAHQKRQPGYWLPRLRP